MRAKIFSVTFSGAGPPFDMLYLILEVLVRSSGVMASSEEDASVRLVLANNVRRGRCGENSILADYELGNTIRGADLEDGVDGFL